MSSFNCCFLTCIHISQEAGQVVWYFHLLKNFPVCCDPQQIIGFGVVNKAKVDVFLELSWFFDDPVDVGNLISGFSAFSKSSLNIWKFMVHILLKPDLEDFEHFFASVWEECNCALYYCALADLTVCTVEPSLIYCEMSVKLCYPVWGPPPSQPHVAIEHLKCDLFELRCALSMKFTLYFKDTWREQQPQSDILAWRIPMDGGAWQAVVYVTLWTVACQACLSMGFSRQEYWNGLLPFSRGSSWPRNWTWVSSIADGFFTIWTTRESLKQVHIILKFYIVYYI